MNSIIFFGGTYLIYIAAIYAIYTLWKQRSFFMYKSVIVFSISVMSWTVAHILKIVVASPRPDVVAPIITVDDIYGFPSGHATFMFALAIALYEYDKRAGIILFLLAILTGIARVLAGVHSWYDIVGGLLVAMIVSFIAIRSARNFTTK